MQSLFIGLGAVVASLLPWLLTNAFGVESTSGGGTIPLNVRLSFYAGSAVFLGAVLWTIARTREHPPEDLAAFRRMKATTGGIRHGAREIASAVAEMPATMRQLAVVQIATWLGLFCMWLYFPVAVARHVFGAPDAAAASYRQGIEWAGVCFAAYSGVCFAFSFALPALAARLGRRLTHAACLACGALGLLSVAIIRDPWMLLLSMAGVGVAWASILAMPYAMLAGSLPKARTGTYMGIFNFFIVIPEIVASLGFGWVMANLMGNDRLAAVVAGGVFLAFAALLVLRVKEAAPHEAPLSAHAEPGVTA